VTTDLTLDTPKAKAALARCVRLLLTWADEAEENETAVREPDCSQTRGHATQNGDEGGAVDDDH
jgi:hypothetical protein